MGLLKPLMQDDYIKIHEFGIILDCVQGCICHQSLAMTYKEIEKDKYRFSNKCK